MAKMEEKEISELERLLEKLYFESSLAEFMAKMKPVTAEMSATAASAKKKKSNGEEHAKLEALKKLQELKGEQILKGIAASPGIAVGRVRNVHEHKLDLMVRIHRGEIVVGNRFEPWHHLFLQSASALVTNSGGKTSNAVFIARQLNIPAVVGTVNGTTVLEDGQKVVVDGTEGAVYVYKE